MKNIILIISLFFVVSIGFGQITGSGTTNNISKFTGSNSIGNSLIIDDGTSISISKNLGSGILFNLDNSTGTTYGGQSSYTLKVLGAQSIFNGSSGTSYGIYSTGGNAPYAGANSYGLYVLPGTGAGNNYAGYFGGNVGIGTTAPAYPLDVAGVMRSVVSGQSSSSFVLQNTNASFNNSLFYGFTTRTGSTAFKLLDLRTNNGATNPMWVDGVGNAFFDGNVGIGTPTPAYKIDVVGSAKFTLSTSNFYIYRSNGTSIGLYVNSSDGKVGIGTTSPSDALQVIGQVRASSFSNADGTAGQPSYRFDTDADIGMFRPAANNLSFSTAGAERLRISEMGNVLINKTSQTNTNYKLDVAGSIRANEVVVNTDGADFVFDENYSLASLSDVEKFVKINKHLPEISSAQEMQKEGVSVGELQTKLLSKIEELTLYMIAQNKRIEKLEKENSELKIKN